MIGPLNQHRTIPPIRTGYPINGGRCPFSVVVPIARTNMVLNPSLETNTTNWSNTGVGTSIARSTEWQFSGVYSLKVTLDTGAGGSDDGAGYGGTTGLSTTSGTTYAISIRGKFVPGVGYTLMFGTSTTSPLARMAFKGTGRTQTVWLIYTETSTATNRQIFIVRDGSGGSGAVVNAPFYIDGVQCEACETGNFWPTTYIDGDQQGLVTNQFPPAYVWNGTPHGSMSSRSGQTRAGGRVMSLSKFGLLLTAIVGLGMVPPEHQGQNFAVLDGSQYDRTRKPDRSFSLIGRIDAPDDLLLRRYRSDLANIFDRDLIGEQQPLKLLYQTLDYWNNPTSDQAEIVALYQGGLEGNHDNDYAQDAVLTFTQKLPIIYLSGSEGATLTPQLSVSNANAVLTRSPAGIWSALSTGMSGGAASVYAIVRGLDGTIYAAGDFTNAGGSGADYIAKWDGSAWSVLQTATSINGPVFALAVGPDGRIYVGGNFTNAGGVGAADYIAVYDPSANTYAALSTGMDAAVNALAFTPSGTLYATGAFTTAGGGAARRIALWNGSVWSALGTGLDPAGAGVGLALAVGPDGSLYVGGGFTNAGGTSVNYIAKWNGSAFSALAGGMDNVVRSIAFGLNGRLYAGGDFTTAGGISASRIATWNGVGWAPLGSGVGGSVSKIAVMVDGQILVGGSFTTAGGITIPDSFAIWNGGGWTYADVDLPGSPNVFGILVAPDNTIYLGFTTTGTATATSTTTITNSGSGRTYPTITIKGPSSGTARIFRIANVTTGRAIYLNYTINAGETATLVLDPSNLSFTSDFQGNIASTILAGSNEADFFLQPGSNIISFLSASSSVTALLKWQPTVASLDDLVLTP